MTKDDLAKQMRQAADQIEAVMSAHEADKHGGATCMMNRISAVAFLGHCLGLRADDLATQMEITVQMFNYEARCPDCQHRREGDGGKAEQKPGG